MKREYVMGNGAIALGALAAGVNVVTGYPGTPSSEIIETIGKYPHRGVHLEWSVNEKAAMEVAASAAYAGARTLVTMKQVGLNVASDPLMSLAYVGVKGGMVIVSADDPGPISSQTEQDTRRFAEFARIPVFDPTSPEEAFLMIQEAFEVSEKYHTPVLFRPTTRICHAYANIEVPECFRPKEYEGFVKDAKRWVIFPRLSFANHSMIERRNPQIGEDFSDTEWNTYTPGCSGKAVLTGGVSYAYAKEFLQDHRDVRLMKIGTPYPFPEKFVREALEGVEEVLVFEELSPFLEEELLKVIGKYGLKLKVYGKLSGHVPAAGENSCESAEAILGAFLGLDTGKEQIVPKDAPALPVRPPVLCAGCPHRASFYAVKQAMKGRRSYFCGDIGCYTLGNAMPLDMCDTCLCMGAGVTMAQGFHWVDEDMDGASFALEEQIRQKEGERILKQIQDDAYVITLEIQGKMYDSVAFAKEIEKKAIYGTSHIQFVIGGSLGLSKEVCSRSNLAVSFSRMTFPHQLMRVILLEQIYRGFRIINGEPYHK